ncbi:TRP-domain-containing protein [Aureobasidium sp. EXF-10727]|nr:TRP-domain-containing protein [Aureobasidium sp. EXF-10727]
MVASRLLAFAITLLAAIQPVIAASDTRYVTTTNSAGQVVYLPDDRRPSLYTGKFGDCKGSSAVNVTRFDAAYYKDNMTVLFHLAGNTAIANESLMMYIGVYAYGEGRFDLTFDPCSANIASLCPLNASIPIEANGIIPVAQSDVAAIPPIALSIPDFEGEAVLRIFANSTQSEIGCYSAVVTNGATFSQPKSVGSVLGIFTLIALLASFATAIYGDSVPVMRKHYAHSLSVLVVFSVFQHVYFTGALSMNWPSVLVAWWSNFAWSGGMIYSSSMQRSIDKLIGNNIGNTSQVGAAGSGTNQDGVGGGFDISSIYRRALSLKKNVAWDIYQRDHSVELARDVVSRTFEDHLFKRDLANKTTGFSWYGQPVQAGLPLPGNYSGFAGTLAQENIRVSNAFMTGFLWLLILLVILVASVIAFKWALEALVAIRLLKNERLTFFRKHWIRYTALVALRTLFIAFFMMMLLTMFQFSYQSSGGVKAVAAIIFILFFVGIPACVLYATFAGLASQGATRKSERSVEQVEERQPSKFLAKLGIKSPISMKLPAISLHRQSSHLEETRTSIHDDEEYVMKFGWLSARFRRTRWWFFAVWTFYEFLRACFYAGASGQPMTQVFGLLVVEILFFAFTIWARPFEGQRLNMLVVYLLGFSKVATVALSSAFNIAFNLERITTTVIGIVIIVIQGVLVIVTLIAIAVGAFSSYMSITRNHEDFRPRRMAGVREKYFKHLDRTATDVPRPPKPEKVEVVPEEPKGPYFSVSQVRRVAKIEDEDPDFVAEMAMLHQEEDLGSEPTPNASYSALPTRSQTPGINGESSQTPVRRGRAASGVSYRSTSGSYSNLPRGARLHRPSWTSRDFSETRGDRSGTPIDMSRNVPEDDTIMATPTRSGSRTPKRRSVTMPSLLPPMPNVDELQVGGDVSSRDVIADVPTPTVRPRSGTFSGSRSNTPTPGDRNSFHTRSTTLDMPVRDSRGPLTPAVERDEELYH